MKSTAVDVTARNGYQRRMRGAVLWAIRRRLLRGGVRRFARKQLRGAIYEIEVDGVKLRCHLGDNTSETSIILHGPSPDLMKAVEGLEPGHVFVDIGANCGIYTSFAAKRVGSTGRVIAIEPQPVMMSRLRANVLAANGFANVMMFAVAVGQDTGKAALHVHGSNHGQSSLANLKRLGDEITVPVETLADIIETARVDRIDSLKIDIEGFEDRALLPFIGTAPRALWPRRIFMEITHRKCWQVDCVQALIDAGYRQTWGDREDIVLEDDPPNQHGTELRQV